LEEGAGERHDPFADAPAIVLPDGVGSFIVALNAG
jgi:hypothetical protein